MNTPDFFGFDGQPPPKGDGWRWGRLVLATVVGGVLLFLLGLEIWELWVLLGLSLYLRWAVRGR